MRPSDLPTAVEITSCRLGWRHLLLCAIALTAVLIALPVTARAGSINVWGCHQPDGVTVAPVDRWSSSITTAGIHTANTCGAGGAGYLEITVDAVAHPSHSNGTWKFMAPANTTVTGFSYYRSAAVQNWSDIAGFRSDIGLYDGPNIADWCGPPTECRSIPWGWTGWPLANKPGVLLLLEACALETSCDGNSNGWYRFQSMQVTIEDTSAPTFSTLGGSLVSGSSLTGNASLSFQVADTGVGVYKLHATVDGVSWDDRVIDSNGGKCAPITAGSRNFNYGVPCQLSQSVSSRLNTASLADGQHAVDVKVEDASGNMVTVFHDDVTTRNSPVSTTAPTVTGTPRVAERQTGSTGTWSPAATSYRYQWLRCPSSVTSAAQSGSCTAIVGGTASQYDATTLDAYQRLMIRVTATNPGGTTSATSDPTSLIADGQGHTTPPIADTDGDGIPDSTDSCPTTAGPASNGGCPVQQPSSPTDSDGDGVADSSDGCPTVAGPVSNAGCPVVAVGRSGDTGGGDAGSGSSSGCNPVCGGSYRSAVITGSSSTRSSKAGQGFAMSLVLKLPDGKPVSGALLQVVEKVSRPGATEHMVGTVKTDANGKAVYRSPTRMVPSAVYSATYSAQLPPSTTAVASTSYDAIFRVTHTVASRVTFASSPRRARNGSLLRLAGQVKATLFPKRGLVIRYEAQRAGGKGAGRAKWTQFHATRTNAAGRYSSRYQLRGNRLPSKLTMRACVERDSGWPYQSACSRPYTIRVRH